MTVYHRMGKRTDVQLKQNIKLVKTADPEKGEGVWGKAGGRVRG